MRPTTSAVPPFYLHSNAMPRRDRTSQGLAYRFTFHTNETKETYRTDQPPPTDGLTQMTIDLRAQSEANFQPEGGIQPEPRIVLVMPSISIERFQAAREWISTFERRNVACAVIANAASVAVAARSTPWRVVDIGRNPGFAVSINTALQALQDWDWAIIANDDISMSPESANAIIDILHNAYREHHRGPTFFDRTSARSIPKMFDVFLSTSLLLPIVARMKSGIHRRTESTAVMTTSNEPEILPPSTFKPFSLVAIDHDTWTELEGLSEQFTFYYEDSNFVQRYNRQIGIRLRSYHLDIYHPSSSSSSAHIQLVLPVAVHSAIQYLISIGHGKITSRLAIWAALMIRVPLVGFGKSRAWPHLRGIAASYAASIRCHAPPLPDYSSI